MAPRAGLAAPAGDGRTVSERRLRLARRHGGVHGTAVFYAETGSGLICRVPLVGVAAGQTVDHVSIGGHPDNLSLSPGGPILAATHTAGVAFLLCGLGRLPCRTGWSLFEIDPTTLHATQVLHHDGSVVGAVASAAEVDGQFYFGSVFDDRIGVWRPQPVR